jgi:exonuclease SbcC
MDGSKVGKQMKILSLKGKNLASLEGEFEINFREEPLASSGIFAITGHTGAGKSTLLDAICLALFDDAPRTHKAGENISVVDVLDKSINQKDSRSILRRGVSDGYAQLEFIALDGMSYRSTWAVKRARGKADGALQPVEMRLENLSHGREEQGRKTELLARIVELIGLNFEQFTRAVLLAQGDFATFLKAKQGEKAELLEKLTGTQVYSLISMQIYEKTQQAKADLQTLAERMKDIKLLSEEELGLLSEEKKRRTDELTQIKEVVSGFRKQLDWISQHDSLQKELSLAQNEWMALQARLEEAAPRFSYIGKVDAVQEIRDEYLEWKNKLDQIQAGREQVDSRSKILSETSRQLLLVGHQLAEAQSKIEENEKQYQLVVPQIEHAKVLDVELKSLSERQTELQVEVLKHEKNYKELLAQREELVKNKKVASEKVDALTLWFQEKEYIREVIPAIDRIVAQLKEHSNATNHIASIGKSVSGNEHLLKTRLETLTLAEAELEKLQKELSSEVVLLREKLEEGKPCPVCGSLHHPTRQEFHAKSRWQEEKLEIEKKKLADAIDTKRKEIDLGKEEITRLKATQESYLERINHILTDVAPSLAFISDWRTRLDAGTLIDQLLKTQKIWNDNNDSLIQCKELDGNLLLQILNVEQNIEATQKTLLEQTEKYRHANLRSTEWIQQRGQLLGGKSADEVQLHFDGLRKELGNQLSKIQSQKEKLERECGRLSGELEQVAKNISLLEATVGKLQTTVRAWVASNDLHIDEALLGEITLRSAEWVKAEKVYLQQLKEVEITLSTKLSERRKRLEEHLASPLALNIPSEEELRELLAAKEELGEAAIRKFNEIDFIQKEHHRSRERLRLFEQELQAKQEHFNNWGKLNELLGSANGSKFKEIAQGYTLDVLLLYANKHLHELTRRYRLQRVPDTLALQVVDEDMMGEVRSVHSLSGGESFLISLSLALGLSSLSSNRMKIESLFIDEGFGSLDIDTLNAATDALENLQTQGRKIGVISHVAEMTERIKTQVRVIKLANGKSRVEVVG